MSNDGTIRLFRKLIAPLSRRVMLMLGRAVVRAISDSEGLQRATIEVFKDDLLSNLERFQDYGFTSAPLEGADALVGFIAGNRDHGIVIKIDDRRYRLKPIAPGEVAMYTDEGDVVHIKRGGTILVQATTKLEIATPLVTMSGNLEVTGTAKSTGAFGCNGATPQTKVTLPANATNDATSYALNNAIKQLLINNGQAQ